MNNPMGRASMNEIPRSIFSPGVNDPKMTTQRNLNSGLRAYAQPHTGPFGSQVFKSAKGNQLHQSMVLEKSEDQQQPLSNLSNNIMKVSSEDLSYSQVKSVRGQIQRDCSLLRNRVRLLQTEMEKTNKKISETNRKTEMMKKAKEYNDARFKEKLEVHRLKEWQAKKNRELYEKKKEEENKRFGKINDYYQRRNRSIYDFKQ